MLQKNALKIFLFSFHFCFSYIIFCSILFFIFLPKIISLFYQLQFFLVIHSFFEVNFRYPLGFSAVSLYYFFTSSLVLWAPISSQIIYGHCLSLLRERYGCILLDFYCGIWPVYSQIGNVWCLLELSTQIVFIIVIQKMCLWSWLGCFLSCSSSPVHIFLLHYYQLRCQQLHNKHKCVLFYGFLSLIQKFFHNFSLFIVVLLIIYSLYYYINIIYYKTSINQIYHQYIPNLTQNLKYKKVIFLKYEYRKKSFVWTVKVFPIHKNWISLI